MHADDFFRPTGHSCDLRDGKRRRVGRQDSIRMADFIQLTEHGFLCLHIFRCCLYNDLRIVKIRHISASLDTAQHSILILFTHAAFLHRLCKSTCDPLQTAIHKLLLLFNKRYFIPALCHHLDDPSTHCSCTKHTCLFHSQRFLSFRHPATLRIPSHDHQLDNMDQQRHRPDGRHRA